MIRNSDFPLQHPLGNKAQKRPVADDDVVHYLDPHQVAGLLQAAGDVDVFAGGGRIAGWVVVLCEAANNVK
jgi:hypothetical protein